MRRILILTNLVFILLVSFLILIPWLQNQGFNFLNANKKTSIILTTFGYQDGDAKWQGEVTPYIEKLQNPREISDKFPMCTRVFSGNLYGEEVLVVISGMGKVKMTSCVSNLLQEIGDQVKEVILSGIGGITPMRGGLINEDGNLRQSKETMIGDICINSAAVDFDLQYYTADQAGTRYPNPIFWLSDLANFSGQVDGSPTLAQELFAASAKVDWPQLSDEVKTVNRKYHTTSREPIAWGPTMCLEVTGDLFWHDYRADRSAREIGSEWLSKTRGSFVSADDIVIVTSMESVAAGNEISWWNKNYKTDIAFAYVRGASNFDQAWVTSEGMPVVNGKTSIENGASDSGVTDASKNASLPILKMFELRSN